MGKKAGLSQVEVDEARRAFALGYLSARGRNSQEDRREAEFVGEVFAGGGPTPRDVRVKWSDGRATVSFMVDREETNDLAAAALVPFSQGVLSALLVLEETTSGNPLVRLPEDVRGEATNALGVLGIAVDFDSERVGAAALDVLGRIVEGAIVVMPSFEARFEDWRSRMAHVQGRATPDHCVRVQLVREGAVMPQKEHVSDSGYDLSLLYEKKRLGRTVLYGTGVIVEPPFGWYFDVVPRSSIIKRGYILANSVGVIDRSYRGEIFVPLIKIDPDAPDLDLPARVAQLIPRPVVHFPVIEEQSLSATQRGAGGFGSTGT